MAAATKQPVTDGDTTAAAATATVGNDGVDDAAAVVVGKPRVSSGRRRCAGNGPATSTAGNCTAYAGDGNSQNGRPTFPWPLPPTTRTTTTTTMTTDLSMSDRRRRCVANDDVATAAMAGESGVVLRRRRRLLLRRRPRPTTASLENIFSCFQSCCRIPNP